MAGLSLTIKKWLHKKKGHLLDTLILGIELVLWNNNGAVTMASNFESIEPVGVARCWSKDAKDYVNVSRPTLIASFNKYMGGTDQMDQAISVY